MWRQRPAKFLCHRLPTVRARRLARRQLLLCIFFHIDKFVSQKFESVVVTMRADLCSTGPLPDAFAVGQRHQPRTGNRWTSSLCTRHRPKGKDTPRPELGATFLCGRGDTVVVRSMERAPGDVSAPKTLTKKYCSLLNARGPLTTKNPRPHWEKSGFLDVFGLLATCSWRREGDSYRWPKGARHGFWRGGEPGMV